MYRHKFQIAPMLDLTDHHYRYIARLITKKSLLYTEMVITSALLHVNKDRFLNHSNILNPVSFQLGGSNIEDLVDCAKIVEKAGFSEINLNVGCPSNKVQKGKIGAILMKDADLVAKIINNIKNSIQIPVTVKHRIGVDNFNSYQFLQNFIGTLYEKGCNTFIIHARNAILNGLSTSQNRSIPSLEYEKVFQIKKDFPNLNIIINGGINSLDEGLELFKICDGIMIGRSAYYDMFILKEVDKYFYNDKDRGLTRQQIMIDLFPYFKENIEKGVRPSYITKHLQGLFYGFKKAKYFRFKLVNEINNQPFKTYEEVLNELKN